MSEDQSQDDSTEKTRATASRLSAAFASMMQPGGPSKAGTSEESLDGNLSDDQAASPRGIIEAILFVGLPGNNAQGELIPGEQIAAAMRNVTIEEVAQHVADLNAFYDQDDAPYRIEEQEAAYRMMLHDEFRDVLKQIQGEPKAVKLSPAALEVLSIIAYRQPIHQADVDDLRGEKSGLLLKQLERRGIVLRIDSEESGSKNPEFKTSDRFLEMMSLESLDQLPRIAEHND